MGRWMTPDWSAKEEPVPYAKLDNPQSLNLYSYVKNNPLSQADPDGHCCEEEEPEEEIREGESFGREVAQVERQMNANEFNEREQRINPGAAPLSPEQVEVQQAEGRQNLHNMLHPDGDMLDRINGIKPAERTNNEPFQLAAGKAAHRDAEVRAGEEKEVRTPSGKRMDRYNKSESHIREIKKNNPRQIKAGQQQLNTYKKEMETATGKPHTTELTKY